MSLDDARAKLVAILQLAHSGELAAAHAYDGHGRSLRDPNEKREVRSIRREELDHRACVRRMLDELGCPPEQRRERRMALIGRTISFLCMLGGWFVPMYGAGRLESRNVREYEDAARLALEAGLRHFVDDLLHMAEVEWEHELYFRVKCQSHWLGQWFPKWIIPEPKRTIRASYARFEAARAEDAAAQAS